MIDEEFYKKKFSDYKFQSVIYLISSGNQVLYLHKLKPKEPTHNKLIGWGGNLEPFEDVFTGSIRELEEELENSFNIKLDLNKENLFLQGVLIRHDFKRVIYILKAPLKVKVPEKKVFNEGRAIYKPLSYHKQNPNEFMANDLEFLDDLLFSNNKFEIIVDEDKSIEYHSLDK